VFSLDQDDRDQRRHADYDHATATDNGASTLYYHSRSIGLSVSNGDNYVVSFHFDPNRRPEHRLEERQLHQRAATEHDYSPYSDDEGNFPGREDF
jgi:hypothetical protein